MLTPGLESLIQKGKAEFHSFTSGASGASRIPVPEGSFAIITDFDYFPFIDLPEDTQAVPAVGFISLQAPAVPGQNNVTFTFLPGAISLGPVVVDFLNQATSQANINTAIALNPNFSGWTCQVQLQVGPLGEIWLTYIFTTPTPAFSYNGWLPGFTCPDPQPPTLFNQAILSGGTDGTPVSLTDAVNRSIHQISFQSTKGRNSFIFRDNLSVTISLINGALVPVLNVWGMFNKGCYLVHTEDIQVDVLTVPDQAQWAVNYSNLPDKSQEFPTPSGYGQGAMGFPAIREIIFDSAGNTQQYLPLTHKRESLPLISGQYREQFKIDVNNINKLNDPTLGLNPSLFFFTGRNYPILNVNYVLVKMNYNKFVSSNG